VYLVGLGRGWGERGVCLGCWEGTVYLVCQGVPLRAESKVSLVCAWFVPWVSAGGEAEGL